MIVSCIASDSLMVLPAGEAVVDWTQVWQCCPREQTSEHAASVAPHTERPTMPIVETQKLIQRSGKKPVTDLL